MKEKKSNILPLVIFCFSCAVAVCLFYALYRVYQVVWLYSVAITFLTIFYHFFMRLCVGEIITLHFKYKQFPMDKWGFRLHGFEEELYKKLNVKRWKVNAITAKPEQFDLSQVSPEELLHNVLQAELVHRIIMILSYVPLLFIIPFSAPVVFIVTSFLSSIADGYFVIIQRFNRPRVIRYVELCNRRKTLNGKGE